MILGLAWLERVADTPEHRGWLKQMTDELLRFQDECGAIREELGEASRGLYGAPKTNEAYATAEAPLIQVNGDPVCDLLYTSNFAYVGLVEAAAATGDVKLQAAVDKMTDFLVRIQAHSPTISQTHGAWFRGFDFKRWEHWGANADAGWGVWCCESGWTQGWITTMLTMVAKGTNLWDFTANSKAANVMDRLRREMIPDRLLDPKTADQYVGDGHKGTLGLPHARRLPVYHDDTWLCYVAQDLQADYDLGAEQVINHLGGDFMAAPSRGLHFPEKVEFFVSTDGKNFQSVGSTGPGEPEAGHMVARTLIVDVPAVKARYVRMKVSRFLNGSESKALNGALQSPGEQKRKRWIWVDEVVVG
jgi:hypothetical protein